MNYSLAPSCPVLLRPQQAMLLSGRIAQVWLDLPQMARGIKKKDAQHR